jgi:hypothetical protein
MIGMRRFAWRRSTPQGGRRSLSGFPNELANSQARIWGFCSALNEKRVQLGGVKAIPQPPPNSEVSTRFVDARFLAKKYKVSSRQIHLLAADKRIPSFRIGLKCIRFDEEAVARVLEGGGEAGI